MGFAEPGSLLPDHAEQPCRTIDPCLPGPSSCLGNYERGPPMPELTTGSIFDDVDAKISVASPDEDTRALWADIRAAFDGSSDFTGV